MNYARSQSGVTLIEAVIGTVLIAMSSLFLVSAVHNYIVANARAMSAENLSMAEKDVQQAVMPLLTNYMRTASFSTPYCNFSQQPLSAVFASPLPSGIQLTLVDNAHAPPDIPQATIYTQARTRCMGLSNTGSFATAAGIHFCATAKAAWQSSGGVAVMAETVLLEFFFSIRDATSGGVITCDRLVNYPLAPPPAASSSLVAHLMLDAYAVNRPMGSASTAGSTPPKNLITRHGTGAIRNALPFDPASNLPIGQLSLSAGGAHLTGRHLPPATFLNAAYFGDCFGLCSGTQGLSAKYLTGAIGVGANVVTGVYIQKRSVDVTATELSALPNSVPPGWSPFGQVRDCNNGGCTGGTQTFAQHLQTYSSVPSGTGLIASAIWATPAGTHSPDGLMCPRDFTLVGRIGDCSTTPCNGVQNVCVLFLVKP